MSRLTAVDSLLSELWQVDWELSLSRRPPGKTLIELVGSSLQPTHLSHCLSPTAISEEGQLWSWFSKPVKELHFQVVKETAMQLYSIQLNITETVTDSNIQVPTVRHEFTMELLTACQAITGTCWNISSKGKVQQFRRLIQQQYPQAQRKHHRPHPSSTSSDWRKSRALYAANPCCRPGVQILFSSLMQYKPLHSLFPPAGWNITSEQKSPDKMIRQELGLIQGMKETPWWDPNYSLFPLTWILEM